MRIMPSPRERKRGFTLFELLLVIAILIFILLLVLINFRTQIARGNDIKRKTDLGKIQKTFEEYFNDKQCYPQANIITNCGGTELVPYLPRVPCDPVTKIPYLYVTGTPTACSGYHICAKLENIKDSDITRIGCDPIQGCGWGVGYNYCLAVGSGVVAPDWVPSDGTGDDGVGPFGTPTPTPRPGIWACTNKGDCNVPSDPSCGGGGACCPRTFESFGCVYNGIDQCANPANRCKL